MHLVNAIALEAYKKYILVSLIYNGHVRPSDTLDVLSDVGFTSRIGFIL